MSNINDQVLLRTSELMRGYLRSWWIAGGWAIDLYLGHQSRPHHDIDVAVLRRDQHILRRHLQDWHFTKMVNSISLAWPVDEYLELPVHEVYAENDLERLEFLLNEAVDDKWFFRRNQAISAPLKSITQQSETGTPYLSPEVVLLYKAKSPRANDHADFNHVLPKLDANAQLISYLCTPKNYTHV